MRAWALELECAGDGEVKEEEGVGKKVDPYPLIWADAVVRPHQPSKTRLPPKRRDKWHGWVTHVRIDENPVKGVHDLCFDKTFQGNRLAKHAEVEK